MSSIRTARGGITGLMLLGVCAFGGLRSQGAAPWSAVPQPADGDKESAAPEQQVAPVLQHRNPRYRLRPDDVLDLKFAFSPQLNQAVSVAPDGYIALPNMGDMYVQGKSIPEVVEALQATYGKILNEPVITVELKSFERPHFVAGGEVGHPGRYELRGAMTVAEALQVAGGLTPASKHSEVLLFRRVSNDWMEVKKLNVKKMLKSGSLAEDVSLRDGDMLFVPKNAVSKIERFMPRDSLGLYFRPGN